MKEDRKNITHYIIVEGAGVEPNIYYTKKISKVVFNFGKITLADKFHYYFYVPVSKK